MELQLVIWGLMGKKDLYINPSARCGDNRIGSRIINVKRGPNFLPLFTGIKHQIKPRECVKAVPRSGARTGDTRIVRKQLEEWIES